MTAKPVSSAGRKRNEEARAKLRAIFERDINADPSTAKDEVGCGITLAYEIRRIVREEKAAA